MKILGITIGIALLLVLVGGGVFLLARSVSNDNTNTAVEENSNVSAIQNTNTVVTTNINTGEPGTTITEATLPADYPTDLYQPKDGSVVAVDLTGNTTRVGFSISAGGGVTQLAMKSAMEENGWTRTSQTLGADATYYESSWVKERRTVQINMSYIDADNEETTLIEVQY